MIIARRHSVTKEKQNDLFPLLFFEEIENREFYKKTYEIVTED